MTENDLINFIAGSKWIFAKTMPWMPHEYILLKQTPNREFFLAFAKAIFEHGTDERFGKRTYRYLYFQGYKYWSMDPTPEQTDLINRSKIRE